MAVLEALSCAKPVVLRDIEAYTDILTDYCLLGKDNDDFLRIITDLSQNQNLMAHWQDKALEGSRFYSEGSVLKMWEALYDTAYQKALNKQMKGNGISLQQIISHKLSR